MREALARADHDFILTEEPRRAPRKAPARNLAAERQPAQTARKRGAFARIRRKPARAILIGAVALLAVSVVVNALVLQTDRHPAPLFGLRKLARAAPPVEAPLPPPRPATLRPDALDPTPLEMRPAERVAKTPAPEAKPARAAPLKAAIEAPPPAPIARPARPAETRPTDAIGALINGERPPANIPAGAPTQLAPKQTAAAAPTEHAHIEAAQRALSKLGFDVDVDGRSGPGTRAAIEQFERKNNLPVTGQISGRTLKTLATRAGVPIP